MLLLVHMQTSTAVKQFKDLRSLSLKIVSLFLNKYENHDLGCEFWDLFFMSVKALIDGFKQEGSSSEKPSSLFSCFLAMSRSHKLVFLLCRESNLLADIFSILTLTTASEAIISGVLKFIENLLILDNELDAEDIANQRVVHQHLEALVTSLHCLFQSDNVSKRYETSILHEFYYSLLILEKWKSIRDHFNYFFQDQKLISCILLSGKIPHPCIKGEPGLKYSLDYTTYCQMGVRLDVYIM